ncbi:hypothetical protein BT96DRAFT_156579 [Gymnopus androsaceus JB14]|uniref:MYND-type domain-containing protein n=1 Tax=Gymnopus androsaceus JB14 TaxID=1447944 RepID=A0A6A4HCB4_9AGAR|nr:hypothetical protein BT96DRAFT_156579 [Gymnopus androsaceus JB14]
MGCTVAFYCSHVCQRSHWIQKHRQECRAHVKNRGDGIPRPLEDRDQQLADSMLESELWHIRPRLLQAQNDHRKSLPVSSATITLVTYIDISISKEKLDTRIWTLDFAKQVGPHSDLILDEFVQTLEQEQQEGMDVGPLVLVKTPYPGPMAFKAMILSKPAIEVPSHNISPMKTYVH